jgi:hypothetical protein
LAESRKLLQEVQFRIRARHLGYRSEML